MKGLFKLALFLLIVGGIAYFTCPDEQAHKDALKAAIEKNIGKELGLNEDKSNDVLGILGGISQLGSNISEWYLDSELQVENHYVYSVGRLTHGGETDIVSVGVFGHVFTGDDEIVKKLSGE